MSDDVTLERKFTILYGSETGNAQDVAERIARQARRRRITTSVQSMDEYDITNLVNEPLVTFVLSTTGNGDFPSSSLSFWKFLLRSNLPSDILCDLNYTIFGLGDSSYARYCWPSRKLNKRLLGLGAEVLMDGGEADDQHYLGIEGTLRPWMEKLWTTLEEVLPSISSAEQFISDDELLPPSITIKVGTSTNGITQPSNGHMSSQRELPSGWRWSRLRNTERMTRDDHWQDVRLLEFEDLLTGKDLVYEAGDVVSLLPENSPEDVQRLLNRMSWSDVADSPLHLEAIEPDQSLPQALAFVDLHHLTLRKLLTTHVDFNSVPRPSFFEQLIPFTPTDHMQREKLQEFCTPGDGSDEMYEYAIRVRRTILETLEEFDSVNIPLTYLLDIFPPIRKRDFSIASGPHCYPTSVQLAVAIVSYKTRLKEKRKGVCSSWLSRLQKGDLVAIQINEASLRMPSDPSLPAIFIGPGTGVAPIRSFLQERLHLLCGQGMKSQDNLCFFGCRNRGSDWLFADEWEQMARNNNINYRLAASRDQKDKIYVQHLIAEEEGKVWDILAHRSGYLYICGSAGKMPQAVRDSVAKIACSHGGKTEEEAERFITQLELQGRWLEECWS
ncbi:hypothetical protein CBS101457_003523 [Exobasidium rhododendri]|nr:hypothetical protein CBS101457_003523 [Exobasidium rhododendri]